MKYLYIWLIIINIITFAVFGIDKKKAIDGKFRISELTLFVLSFLGGSLGGLAAMHVFHHKTKKCSSVLNNATSEKCSLE